ncbi:hypothetical protein FRC12_018366 [Ceratobasidium sp. 428]|nr:hypothetical protein FRC12_018366 [Ceratobasidium sp. 428]
MTENAKAGRGIFENTASLIRGLKRMGSSYETASHQGAGLTGLKHVLWNGVDESCQVFIERHSEFGEAAYRHDFKPRNQGVYATYRSSYGPAESAPTIDGIENLPQYNLLTPHFPTLLPRRSRSTLTKATIQPGSAVQITLSFTNPKQTDPETSPVYSGMIFDTSSDGSPMLRLTYLESRRRG